VKMNDEILKSLSLKLEALNIEETLEGIKEL
jgi:hypothetical protein